MSRTLLALMVPEAEPLVGDLRARLDPAAQRGLGAHITLVYPFVDSDNVDDVALERLRGVARAHAPPSFQLDSVRTFPSTVWLKPSPGDAIVALAAALEAAFPERPRDGRTFPDYVPHLSVARNVRGDRAIIVTTLEDRLHASGPIPCTCRHVHVMQRASGAWRNLVSVPLGTSC
jgi:2'-5' RNA ligase